MLPVIGFVKGVFCAIADTFFPLLAELVIVACLLRLILFVDVLSLLL